MSYHVRTIHLTLIGTIVFLFLQAGLAYGAPASVYTVEPFPIEVRTIGALDRDGTAYGSATIAGAQHAAQIHRDDITKLGELLGFTASRATGQVGDGQGERIVGDIFQIGTGVIRAWIIEQGEFRLLEGGGARTRSVRPPGSGAARSSAGRRM